MSSPAQVSPQQKQLDQFFQQYREVVFAKKQVLIHAGDEPAGVYYLASGHVRQYDISGRTGNELTIHIYNPHSFLPLTWALNNIPNRYFFQAMDEVHVRLAPRDDVVHFLQGNADQLLALSKRLVFGLDGLMARMEYQVFGSASARIQAELLYLARHFGREEEDGRIVLDRQFTHQGIADLTGTVRETVSVAIERLVAAGLVSYQGDRIVLEDAARLEAELKRLL